MHFRPKPFDRYPSIPVERRTLARDLMLSVCAWHGTTIEQITGRRRTAPIAEARFDAIVAVHKNCRIGGRQLSLGEIGRLFGGRDPSTIWHALAVRGLR